MRAAEDGSSRVRRGTSATTTRTAGSTRARSTSSATEGRRPSSGQPEKPRSDPSPAPGRKRRQSKEASLATPALAFDLADAGGRVVSVFGMFNGRVLVEMSDTTAAKLFAGPLEASSRTGLVEAVERDIALIADRSLELAGSGLAASALAMALEIENPFNSATSKSMCATGLRDALAQLRELIPQESEEDALDDLARRRSVRIEGQSAS